MPFQGDNFNVCGIAVIISATILTRHFNVIPIEETMWLSNIDIYSEYCRKMLITWFLEGKIFINELSKRNSVVC